MHRTTAAVCLCLLAAGIQPVVAWGPPEDDYVDRNCWDARTIDPTNATISGLIDYENDADTVRFDVEEGDTFAFRTVAAESAHEFTVGVNMLESEWTGRIEPGGNTDPRGEWDLAVVLNDSTAPGYARVFSVADDTMCLTVHDDPPEESAYPVAWSLRIVENEVPDWYREDDPPSASTSTPTPTATTALTPTGTDAPETVTPAATAAADSDGDGVPDEEDYAPRDARVQDVEDVRVIDGTDTPSSNALGPGFGPAVALAAVALFGVFARRRNGSEKC